MCNRKPMPQQESRRTFLKQSSVLAAAWAAAQPVWSATATNEPQRRRSNALPWYRRTLRWGQTNITEADPSNYDISWWRSYWKRTQTQGVIVNAGGIFAYYPSQVPFHRPAQFLAGRDLFGELCRAAHEDRLAVFARMDSNRAHEELWSAHPDWFALDAAGKPYKAGELFVTCINGPYYREHIPAILREIIEKYRPEGFTDNSWSGLGRSSICYCENCRKQFRERSGLDLPREKNWDDEGYRKWIGWNYARRVELWDFNNEVTRSAGGHECVWAGMNSGSISGQCQSFRDYREICRRAEIIMLDHQSRSDLGGFQQNAETGKLLHGMLGWDKLIPESMAMYQAGRPTFRVASKPPAEARMWMLEGIAGGIQPWWHHVGAYHEDRRMYHTAEPIYRWHSENEQYLVNRRPVASVGVVWSQRNVDFYGREEADKLVELPWRGMIQALVRARIPYLPVHADDLDRDASQFSVLLLPNLAVMLDAQVASVRRFVERGGNLVATGETSLFNEWGEARDDFGLADILGVRRAEAGGPSSRTVLTRSAAATVHSYLRLSPELRARVDGPHTGQEPPVSSARHPILSGFVETDILPFGGVLRPLRVDLSAQVLATFIPEFPIYPPETAWMRQPRTDIPALIVRTLSSGSRIAFLPADIDRHFARDNLPDHGHLLRNVIRWAAHDDLPLSVQGAGLIDCQLYQQPGRLIVHLVNLTSAGTWRQPVHELIPVGPFHIRLRLPPGISGRRAKLLVSRTKARVTVSGGWSQFEVSRIADHEMVVLS